MKKSDNQSYTVKNQFGLIGENLVHSHSARLHNLLGDYSYELIPLRKNELDRFLRSGNFAGLNVTIPYKQCVIPYCAELSDSAKRIGSVNTLVRRANGTLFGDNTDAFGFAEMVSFSGIRFAGEKALVLGNGGTCRTACAVIREAGGIPVIISRNGENHYGNLDINSDATVIVNTTPMGMYPHTDDSPINLRIFSNLKGVLDVIYNPLRTRLLQQADERGIPHGGGLRMLVMQAARASERFAGIPVPAERVANALFTLRKEATNLVLVGMPGSGKTTIGKLLANILKLPLTDIDTQVERECGCTIPELFAREGEAGFRAREAAQVARYARESGHVLVTGGGAVLNQENRTNLRLNGFVVHITRPLDLLPMDGRPLSGNREALEKLWELRAPLYAAVADITVGNEKEPADCTRAIWEAYHEALCD